MPRLSATRPENVELHPVRREIRALLETCPGANVKEISTRLHCNRGTTTYHLRILERVGMIEALSRGRETHFFLATDTSTDRSRISALNLGRVLDLAVEVANRPGVVQKEITSRLDISRKVLRSYVDLMASHGLLEERTETRWRRYFPTGLLLEVLRRFWPTRINAPLPTQEQPSVAPLSGLRESSTQTNKDGNHDEGQ